MSSNLDNKKYLESILQGGDDDDDFEKADLDMDNIDVDMILNELDDFHIHQENSTPPPKLENKQLFSPTVQANVKISEFKKNEKMKQEEEIKQILQSEKVN